MQEKKDKVLKLSKDLFEKYGYSKTSMDEIAKKSGVTKKTVYSYFKDKESLLNEIIDLEFERLKNKVDKINNKDLDILEFVKQITKYLLNYKNNSKLLNTLRNEKNEIINITSKIDNKIIEYIKDKLVILDNKLTNINIDIDLLSFIIYKINIAIMFEYDKDINEEEVINNITKILNNGLLS